MNPNWPRWIVASVAVYLQAVADSISLPLILEGADERQAENLRVMNHGELRITGPFTNEVSKDYFQLFVDVNVLLTTLMGGNKQNTYDIVQYAGAFQAAMLQPIPLKKFGLDPLIDDGSQIGCLSLHGPERFGHVGIHHFGQIDPVERIKQSSIDGHYEVFLP